MNEGIEGAKKLPKLAKSIRGVHSRQRIPDTISFLDWRVNPCWRAASPGLDRHEEISVDPKLLYYLGWATRSCCKVYLYINGYELARKGLGCEVWTRIHDMAEASEIPQ